MDTPTPPGYIGRDETPTRTDALGYLEMKSQDGEAAKEDELPKLPAPSADEVEAIRKAQASKSKRRRR